MLGRYDLDNYSSAAKTCDNFIPTRYGQVEKRAGTRYLGDCKYGDKKSLLKSFQYSTNTTFILEFGHEYVRFWSNDLQVEDPNNAGNPLEVSTNYQEDEVEYLQMRQVDDIVYIVHPDHPVSVLTRVLDDEWTFGVADIELPFVDHDADVETKLTFGGGATGDTSVIYSDLDAFTPDMVGAQVQMKFRKTGRVQMFGGESHRGWGTVTPWQNSYAPRVPLPPVYDFANGGLGNCFQTTFNQKWYYATQIADIPAILAWTASTAYKKYDWVTNGGVDYSCKEDHTSTSSFATDSTVGEKWKRVEILSDLEGYFEAGSNPSEAIHVTGEWSIKTGKTWMGQYVIQRSIDQGVTWTNVSTITSDNDANFNIQGDEKGEDNYIRIIHNWGDDTTSGQWYKLQMTVTTADSVEYAVGEITSYVSPTEVNVHVIEGNKDTHGEVESWLVSGFSESQGYPRAIAIMDGRMVLAGTKRKPQGFFYSAINNYKDFNGRTTIADDGFFIEAVSQDQSAVQWMSEQRELFVGTASVEGVLVPKKQDEAVSAENLPVVRWNDSMGSAYHQAVTMRDSLLTIQRGRKALNMMSYSLEADGFSGEEVSLMASHLLDSGIRQVANLREPYTGLFAIAGNGDMCHMIYEPKLKVTGWCRFTTQGGGFESVQTLPSQDDEDFVYVIVHRMVNGVDVRCLERFETNNARGEAQQLTPFLNYLDSAEYKVQLLSTTMAGLERFEGEEVALWTADAKTFHATVSGGSITLPEAVGGGLVGYPIASVFEPLDVENQWTVGEFKQLLATKLLLWNSMDGEVCADDGAFQDINYFNTWEAADPNEPLNSKWVEVFHESGHQRQKRWCVRHNDASPFKLQAVIQEFR